MVARLPAWLLVCSAAALGADDGGTPVDPSPPAVKSGIDVEVLGLKPGGKVWVLLYDVPNTFPTKRDKAKAKVITTPSDGRAHASFDDLPPGDYAVATVHDENDNGKLDTNFIGIPREGLGSSRDAKGFIGPPSFDAAKVHFSGGRLTLPIHIDY